MPGNLSCGPALKWYQYSSSKKALLILTEVIPERTLTAELLDIRIWFRVFESATCDMVTDMVENRPWDSPGVGLLFYVLEMAKIVLVWALSREELARPYRSSGQTDIMRGRTTRT